LKRKISNLCDVDERAVVNAADVRNIYELPLVLHDEGPTFEVELGNLYWREQVILSLDSAGVPLGLVGEGKAVPFHDTRLQPPDFQVTERNGAWSPAEGREEAILFTDAEVRAGEWPPGIFD
jgi:hypothetical protein